MASRRDVHQPFRRAAHASVNLTDRQVEVLQLAVDGLAGKQIGRRLGISARTVEDHFRAMRRRTGAHSQGELIAYGVAAGLVKPKDAVPERIVSGTAAMPNESGGGIRRENQSHRCVPPDELRDALRVPRLLSIPSGLDSSLRIGYARIGIRPEDHQEQLDALASAYCHEILVETASSRAACPQLRRALGMMHCGDTLVIYKPDRVARSMKELLVLLEGGLHVRRINLHILFGSSAGLHRLDGPTIIDKMLYMAVALAAEIERDLIRERTLEGLRTAQGQGRRSGRPAAVNDDMLAIARSRRARGESVTTIARHLGIGRSTLYRALDFEHNSPMSLTVRDASQ